MSDIGILAKILYETVGFEKANKQMKVITSSTDKLENKLKSVTNASKIQTDAVKKSVAVNSKVITSNKNIVKSNDAVTISLKDVKGASLKYNVVQKQSTKLTKEEREQRNKLSKSLDKNLNGYKKVGKAKTTFSKVTDEQTGAIKSLNTTTSQTWSNGKESVTVVDRHTKSIKKQMTALQAANKKLNDYRWALVNIGFVAGAVAGAIYGITKVIKVGTEIELMFKKIEVVTGASSKAIEQNITKLTKNSIFSIDDLGKSYLEFTKQGFSAADAMRAMPAIQNLAIIGFTELGTATKMVAQMMHQFSLDASEAARISSVLAKAANLSAADVETFGISMSYAGPLAAQAGMDIEETAASLAILSNRGLAASKSGTSFAAMMTQMISPSTKAEQIMSDLGVSFFDASGKMKDMTQIVAEFSAVLNLLPEEQKTAALVEIFQTRGSRSMSALADSFTEGEGSIRAFTASLEDSTYAMEKAAEISDTTALRMKKVRESVATNLKMAGYKTGGLWSAIMEGIDIDMAVSNINELNKALEKEGIAPLHFEDPVLDTRSVEEKYDSLLYKLSKRALMSTVGFSGVMHSIMGEVGDYAVKDTVQGDVRKQTFTDRVKSEQQAVVVSGALIAKQQLEELVTLEKIRLDTVIKVGEEEMAVADAIKQLSTEYSGLDNLTFFGVNKDLNEVADFDDSIGDIIATFDGAGARFGTEILRAFEDGKLKLKDITGISSEELTILKEEGKTAEEINTIAESRLSILREIIDGKEISKDLSVEEAAEMKKLTASVIEIESHANALKATQTAVNNIVGELVDKYKKVRDISQYNDMTSIFDDVTEAFEKISEKGVMVGEHFEDYYKIYDAWQEVDRYKREMEDLIPVLENFQKQQEILAKAIKQTTADLKLERAELAKDKAALAEVTKTISKLTNARYKDQTATEKLMNAGEMWLLQQKLSDRGIGDAQAYIQEMLGKSEHGYERLFDQVMKVDNAVMGSKTTYDTWVETVSEFIRQTVSSGNQMATNVSGAITKYQTMLASTTKYDDRNETDKYGNVEEVIRNLSDAYSLYYGGMQNDVKFAAQEHKDAADGIYGSSEEVIDSLNTQWNKQTVLTEAVRVHQDEVDRLNVILSDQQKEYDLLGTAIDGILEKFDAMVEASKEAVRGLREPLDNIKEVLEDIDVNDWLAKNMPDSTSNFSSADANGNFDIAQFLSGMTGTSGDLAKQYFNVDTQGAYNKYSKEQIDEWKVKPAGVYNDFVMRPGQQPTPFSPDDTIIGVKDTDGIGGGVNIQNITITGVSGNADEFAYQFAESLRRELRAI